MTAIVFLDTGVEVELPPGTDVDSDEGYALVKARAAEKWRMVFAEGLGEFEVVIDEVME